MIQRQALLMRISGLRNRITGKASIAVGAAICCSGVLLLSGCGKFFPPLTSGGGGGGGGSSSGDYLYIGNQGTNPLTVAGFSLASSALSSISGSAWQVTLQPTALAVTPDNAFLYVGSAAGGIYVYTIGSNGSISLGNSGAPVATGVEPSALRVDTTGKWLIGADAFVGEAFVFQIGSGGLLTSISSSFVTLNTTTPSTDLEIAPSDSLVFVSCGTGGIYTLSFNSSNGALSQVNGVLSPKQSGDADYGMAITPSGNYLMVAETGIGAVRVLAVSSGGGLSEISGSPFKTATGAFAVLVDSSGKYAYVANRSNGNISAFSIGTTGALTAITGSPFSTGSSPSQMVEDKTDTYLAVVNAGGNPDLQVFTISSSTGALTSFKTTSTGTSPANATAIAATH
jgi:6-phosphogluconolactonase (cycloisomerase 2 family)